MRLLTLLRVLVITHSAHARPAQVLLIRHGEKPDKGDNLSDQGVARARMLPDLFTRPEFSEEGPPVALFAQKPKDNGKRSRPVETLEFVAKKFGLTVNTHFNRGDSDALAKEILTNPRYEGKLVAVCWEHNNLEEIAWSLGVRPKPSYPKLSFDRAWMLTFPKDPKSSPRFQDLPEHLLPGDSTAELKLKRITPPEND